MAYPKVNLIGQSYLLKFSQPLDLPSPENLRSTAYMHGTSLHLNLTDGSEPKVFK